MDGLKKLGKEEKKKIHVQSPTNTCIPSDDLNPNLKRVKLLDYGSEEIWGAVKSWEVLRSQDWDRESNEHNTNEDTGDNTATEHIENAALHIAKLVQGCLICYDPSNPYRARHLYCEKGATKPIGNIDQDIQNRTQVLREITNLFSEAASAVQKTSTTENNSMAAILKKQHLEGKLLTVSSNSSLSDHLSYSDYELSNRINQSCSLLWSSLLRILPKGNHLFQVSKTELYHIEIGLLPWIPSEVVLVGKAREGIAGARGGFEVEFSLSGIQLPGSWVTNHMIGCIADAVKCSSPHRKFTTADEHVERGLLFLQHIAVLLWSRSRCEQFGFSVSMSPLSYPSSSQIILSHPITCEVICIVIINSLTVTIRDVTTTHSAIDMVIGCAAFDSHLKTLASNTLNK